MGGAGLAALAKPAALAPGAESNNAAFMNWLMAGPKIDQAAEDDRIRRRFLTRALMGQANAASDPNSDMYRTPMGAAGGTIIQALQGLTGMMGGGGGPSRYAVQNVPGVKGPDMGAGL